MSLSAAKKNFLETTEQQKKGITQSKTPAGLYYCSSRAFPFPPAILMGKQASSLTREPLTLAVLFAAAR